MGGLPVKPEMLNLIIRIWTQMRAQGEEPLAKEVMVKVADFTKGHEDEYGRLPKLRTFQEVIRDAKKKLLKAQTVDDEWSMGSLIQEDLPPDSIPQVVLVWRYAVNCNERFTVTQARWVSRLRHVWKDISDLWYYSRWYAEIERVHWLSGKQPDTSVMDRMNFLTPEERRVLRYSRGHSDAYWQIDGYKAIATHNGKLIEEIMHHKNTQMDGDRSAFIGPLPPLNEAGFDFDSKMMYLALYSHIIKGPRWDGLSSQQCRDLVIELRKWVLKEYKGSRRLKTSLTGQQTFHVFQLPYKLFAQVGYPERKEEIFG